MELEHFDSHVGQLLSGQPDVPVNDHWLFFDENGDDPAPAGGVDDVGHPQLSHVSNSLDLRQIL